MDRLHKILSLLGIDKLEESDQKEVHKVFESIIDEQVNERFVSDEEKTKKLCENILNHIGKKSSEMFESDSTINLFSVVNSAKGLTGDSAKLAGLIVGLLAYISNESEYLSISKSLVSNTGSANENAELHLYKRIQGLTNKQQTFMLEMLDGSTVEEIDKRFDVLLEQQKKPEKESKKVTYECPKCGHIENNCIEGETRCPECNHKMKLKSNDGSGVLEVKNFTAKTEPIFENRQQEINYILKNGG